jgi:hypothetical protein
MMGTVVPGTEGKWPIGKLHGALPVVKHWIENLLTEYKNQAEPVSACGFPQLLEHFPPELLGRAAVVSVPRVPFPPLSQLGLPEFASVERLAPDGITFLDTLFVNASRRTAGLYFHELVHVVQWERLGVDRFLLAYGVGLLHHGYRSSPLEEMAYALQARFDRNTLPLNVTPSIQQQTDAVWRQVAPLLGVEEGHSG